LISHWILVVHVHLEIEDRAVTVTTGTHVLRAPLVPVLTERKLERETGDAAPSTNHRVEFVYGFESCSAVR